MKRYAIPLIGLLCFALSACPRLPSPTRVVISCGPNDDLLNHVHYTNFTPVQPFTSMPKPDTRQINADEQLDQAAGFSAKATN